MSVAPDSLKHWLNDTLDASVEIVSLARLKGGGIQENWTLDALVDGKPEAYVLRKDAPATIEASHSRRHEFALVKAAYQAGVTVPKPVAFCGDQSVFGGSFALMEKVKGVGLGPKIVKEVQEDQRLALTQALARELARLHRIAPPNPDLHFLGKAPSDFAISEINLMREWLDHLKLSKLGLEWALRWCELHIPKAREATLIHRDFRTGNYMLDQGKITAVLDWEFACWGDPMFDIGWFHAECWRFSRPDLHSGGVGERKVFYEAYEHESGRKIDDTAVSAYEVLAHCRWAVIALQQGDRHTSGREPSLEHALTGKIAEELELMALRLTKPERWRLKHQGDFA